jgi:hypothetical protein
MSANLPLTQDCSPDFFVVKLSVGACLALNTSVKFLPLLGLPYHGGIFGVVEVRENDPDLYESLMDGLARASYIIDGQGV